ncbi:MAG: family 16 glycosylhydrolase [Mariniphaga sp.]|nr:family 16 glycosylhydrolase [Mariniphaga sp.]
MNKISFLIIILVLIRFPAWSQDTCSYLVWSDDFEYNGAPDNEKWGYDIGGHGWGNNELQNYTNSRINSFVQDGKLTIKAVKSNGSWSSARLVTKGKGDWLYGRIEVKAKLPEGVGTWPAIWMLPTDWAYGGWPASGEIDIMEHVGYDFGTVHGTIHTEAFNHSIGTQLGRSIDVENVSTEFHVYAIDWTEDEIVWYVDGVEYYRIENPNKTYKEWPFDKRFHLILNIAIGGNWGGAQGIDPNLDEATMEIDYVKVFQKDLPKPVINGKKNAEPNEKLFFSTIEIQGVRYKWSFPEGTEVTNGEGSAQVTVKWGNTGGNVQLELQSDCDTIAADPFFVSVVQKPSGESFEVPLFDDQNNLLWQAVPGSSNQIELTGTASLIAGYEINATGENPHILYEFQNPIDLSSLAKMEISLKTPEPVPGSFRIDLVDANGKVNQNDLFKMNSFENDGNFHTYTYTFGQNPDGIYQLDLIKWIKVYINYGVFGKKGNGQVEIESIKLINTATFSHEIKSFNHLKVWPNPFQDKIRVASAEPIQRLEVFDLTGKRIFEKLVQNQNSAELNLEGLPGPAILKATFQNGTSKKMVVIKHQK